MALKEHQELPQQQHTAAEERAQQIQRNHFTGLIGNALRIT
jgi:hypothetical protein